MSEYMFLVGQGFLPRKARDPDLLTSVGAGRPAPLIDPMRDAKFNFGEGAHMLTKGQKRQIRKKAQGMQVWSPLRGTVELRGKNFVGRGYKQYHADDECTERMCRGGFTCYQGEPGYRYIYDPPTIEYDIDEIAAESPGAFAGVLGLDWREVSRLVNE